jgi:hypothetical protein
VALYRLGPSCDGSGRISPAAIEGVSRTVSTATAPPVHNA